MDDVVLIGARFGVRSNDEKWTATVWGRNLTDEYQRTNAKKTTDGIVGYTGMPTTYGVAMTYNWL